MRPPWLARPELEKAMMKSMLAPIVAALLAAPGAWAQGADGRAEYMSACSACHGESGKGGGPLAGLMEIDMPDLTQLAARNDGEFPVAATLRILDGREEVRAHGSDMPVWGDRFLRSARNAAPGTEMPEVAELIARGRMLSIVYYLESIQE